MKKRILSLALACLMVMPLLAGCGDNNTPAASGSDNSGDTTTYSWKMAHEEYDGDMQDVYCKEFAQKLSEKSNGRITLDIYPVGQIGDALQQCELLQNGGIEFAIVSPGNTGTVVPENQLFSLHYLFPSDWDKTLEVLQTSEALNTMLGQKYLDKNIQVLQYWTEGAMWWTSNKSMKDPSAFKGLKFRTMQSPMILAAYEAYGANPTPMSFSEVFTGLQQNVINGQENPPTLIYASGFQEVQKYLTLDNHVHNFLAVLTNENWLNSLSADDQQLVKDCVAEMVTTQRSMELEDNDAVVAKLQDAGMEVNELTDEQYQAFVDAVQPMYDEYKQQWGTEIFDLATSYNK